MHFQADLFLFQCDTLTPATSPCAWGGAWRHGFTMQIRTCHTIRGKKISFESGVSKGFLCKPYGAVHIPLQASIQRGLRAIPWGLQAEPTTACFHFLRQTPTQPTSVIVRQSPFEFLLGLRSGIYRSTCSLVYQVTRSGYNPCLSRCISTGTAYNPQRS